MYPIFLQKKDLAQKFQLKIEVNNGTRVSPLEENSKVKVIDLIREVLLSVQHIRILETLYVVEGTETILILDTNWFDRYQADIRKSDNKIEITNQREKARLNLLFKKNSDDKYEYLFSLKEDKLDQQFETNKNELTGPFITPV